MENPGQIIAYLNGLGIALSLVDGKLKSKAPKGAITKEVSQLIINNKTAIIDFIKSDKRSMHNNILSIDKSKDDCYEASYAQRRLWITEQKSGHNSLYNVPVILTFGATFNLAALEFALNQIVIRHESLRTVFLQVGQNVLQQIQAPRPISIVEHHSVKKQCTDEQAQEIIQTSAKRPFSLHHDLMVRCDIIYRNQTHTDILICFHHIAFDGWSFDLFLQELIHFYQKYRQRSAVNSSDTIADLDFQYKDFSHWQNEHLSLNSTSYNDLMAYWQDKLKDLPAQHNVPLDYSRPVFSSYEGFSHSVNLDHSLAKNIARFAKVEGLTMFIFMQAVFAVLLARWSSEEDIVIGTPVAGREHSQLKSIIGCFVNTLILRNQVDQKQPFIDFLHQTQDSVLGALAHQAMPFDLLVEALNPKRTLNIHPLHQIAFSFNSFENTQMHTIDATIEYANLQSAKYDLQLHVSQNEAQEVKLSWEYSTDVFSQETIASMSDSFIVLLQAILVDPAMAVGYLPMVQAAPIAKPLMQNNQLLCLTQTFAKWVNQTPDAIALTLDDQQFTYLELNEKANKIAAALLSLTDGRQQLIGLYVERSVEMIIGLLGILQAGAGYLPLDPNNPADRTNFIVDDADVKLIVTQRHLQSRLSDNTSHQLLFIENVLETTEEVSIDILDSVSSNVEDLAYVIYTSGSTGEPKGVKIEHRHIARLFKSAEEHFSFDAKDKWSLFHSFAFDFSVWEIWGAFLYGGTLVIVPYEVSRSPKQFYDYLLTKQVTILNQTPSAFYLLSEEQKKRDKLLALRYVIFGGDKLEPKKLEYWYQRYPQSPELVNMYGITETTVHVTFYKVGQHDLTSIGSPIGRPLNDLVCLVCNEFQQLQPAGAPGELLIGGAGVASGYLNRPQLTSERFVILPHLHPTMRFYRSGDLVRSNHQGALEYFGRIDAQVKLRGFRIELGEIQQAIEEVDTVKQALVRLHRDSQDNDQLIGYIASVNTQTDDLIVEVNHYLTKKLPSYMVVNKFICLDNFPLTNNGKVNIDKLPPFEQAMSIQQSYRQPRTPLETTLCKVWAQVLVCERIGIDDNFFAMGGDSIRVLELVKVMEEHNLIYDVQDVFLYQSISQLSSANVLSKQSNVKSVPMHLIEEYTPERSADSLYEDAYPLTSMQQLMVDKQQQFGSFIYTPAHLLSLDTTIIDQQRLIDVLTFLIQKNPTLRTEIVKTETNEYLQYVRKQAELNLSVVDLNEQPKYLAGLLEGDIKCLAELPMKIGFGQSLVQFKLFLGAPKSTYILITAHHAIEDGWGFVGFLNELQSLYFSDEPKSLEVDYQIKNVFKEHLALELEAAKSNEYKAVWTKLLAGFHCMIIAEQQYIQRELDHSDSKIEIPSTWILAIKERANNQNVSFRTLILYAYFRALSELCEQDSITIDVVMNSRSNRLSDPLGAVGLFWNLLPINLALNEKENAQINLLHNRLLETESFAHYPRSAIAANVNPNIETFAAFNFVSFHHYQKNSSNKTMNVDKGIDRFHHPLKLIASLDPTYEDIYLYFEYCPQRFTKMKIDQLASCFKTALNERLDDCV
ncbi:MAG: amino acid adenylation domain-containing protein [Algicola sp.]|nr:amino acid adenylation domain-containing protein [Algicola sp.]